MASEYRTERNLPADHHGMKLALDDLEAAGWRIVTYLRVGSRIDFVLFERPLEENAS